MESKLDIVLNILAIILVEIVGISLLIEVFSKEGLYLAKIFLVFTIPCLFVGAKAVFEYIEKFIKKDK